MSNQLFHSIYGFNNSFFYGKKFADKKNIEHDDNASPLGIGGENVQDIWLGMQMSDLGEGLKKGIILKGDTGKWILDHIADSNYATMAKSQIEQIKITELRKKFRVMEYQLNGNTHNKWWYNADIQKYGCNENLGDIYYQDYEYIFVDGKNVGEAKAIWDEEKQKILLIYWDLKNQYNSKENICGNFDQLINQYGLGNKWKSL